MQHPYRRLAAVALAAAVVGSTASAASADTQGMSVQTQKRSPEAIARHWTPKRLRNAKPMAIPVAHGGRHVTSRRTAPGGAPLAVDGSRARLRQAPRTHTTPPATSLLARSSFAGLELPWINTSYGAANPINPVGRLYFTGYSRQLSKWYDSYCTGTLVAPNIVITAAHCIREGRPDGVRYQNFTFAPAVNGTSRPFGTFTSRNQATFTSFYSNPYITSAGTDGTGYYGQDYAFVVLDRDAWGRNAGDANMAGTYGFLMNAPKSDVYHLGYPGEGNWNGCTTNSCKPWHCASPLQRYTQYPVGLKWDLGFSCYTTGGASGGPIFQLYNGRWYVTSVLSHMGKVYCQNGAVPCPAGSARYGTTFFGSYLDNDVQTLFNFAKTL
jgi:V8-like Glu-specific endopeptidase